MRASDLPSFANLPPVEGMPHGCAWGLFDRDGVRDQLGTLNLLTPEVVLAARDEIRTGTRVSVDWPLTKPDAPLFFRQPMERRYLDFLDTPERMAAHDDVITFNTQTGSQWDGLKHAAHQATRLYYNNLPHASVPHTLDNGIHHWSEAGGIVGRGVLLDYVAYAARHGISYHPMEHHLIGVDALEGMVRDQGLELRAGDVLIVRSGFIKWYKETPREERERVLRSDFAERGWAGVEGCLRTVEWLWDHHFAAVAGDCISFEQFPFNKDCTLHEYQLAFWGSPIGEIWDLEKLAAECERQKRWSFFFTSAPLNVPGGVASPPNAICIL